MSHPESSDRRIAIFVSFSGTGGVERMISNLASGMARRGLVVDLLLAKAQGGHLSAFPDGVRIIKLPSNHTLTSLFALRRYLSSDAPAALLAAKDRAIKTAVLARMWSGTRIRLAGRLGTNVSAALGGKGRMRQALWRIGMRAFYRHTDVIICVSEGVAEDVRGITGIPADRLTVIRNPVVTPELRQLADRPADHPWLEEGEPPVILGVGRLTEQKDFATLIRAFARLQKRREARLIILGEGRRRADLQSLCIDLGVNEAVDLPGFKPNPYAYMARAAVFVLSSRWEGSPNVLTEALALGTPSVATDCPSGPREILQDGRIGPLVPMGDAARLAAAIEVMLESSPAPEQLRAAVAEYSVERSVAAYVEALRLG